MTPKVAEDVAQNALLWLAADEERMMGFLQASGAGPQDVRDGLKDPAFLAMTLDVLLNDEAAVLAFCEAHRVAPDTVLRARAALPGGDLPNWT